MLQIVIPANELYDESTNSFYNIKEHTLQLEHSLISVSKWESKWCIPFLESKGMTDEQTIDYVKCMTLNKNVDPNVYKCLTNKDIKEISDYISAPMTATTVRKMQPTGGHEIVTSELIYYWMIELKIPVEFEKWHLNRLITLIQVCNIKNTPPKKMSQSQLAQRNRMLNAARRKKLNTTG